MAYLDAAADRLDQRFKAEVEIVRAGTLFAHDGKAYGRWHRSTDRTSSALSAEGLEVAVMSLARSNPEYVVVGK